MSSKACPCGGVAILLVVWLGACPAWGEETGGDPLGLGLSAPKATGKAAASEVVLTAAVSRRSHGLAGNFDIPLPLDTFAIAGIESRAGGPSQVVLTFSGLADGAIVQASAGNVGTVLVEGTQVTVELSSVPNAACLSVAVSGIPGLASKTSVCIRVLAGDANADGVVNIFDLVRVRNHLNQPVTADAVQADVSADGAINIFDLVEVRNYLGTAIDCLPDPPPGMVLVPAGEFLMGDAFNEGRPSELPRHAVYVDAFYMDSCEVTNQQYAEALNWAWSQGNLIMVMNGCVYQAYSGISVEGGSGVDYPYCCTTSSSSWSRIIWDGTTFGVMAGKEDYPMALTSWYGAAAYSNWRSEMEDRTPCYNLSTWECDFNANGYRLPTEAEWEKAARGGVNGRRFPWADDDAIQHPRANYMTATSGYHPLWRYGDMPYTSPVGFFNGELRNWVDFEWPGRGTTYQTANGASDYGLYDMAGNVTEWCNDGYDSNYYATSPYSNPRGPVAAETRVLRGGSWNYYDSNCRVANRYGCPPSNRGDYGFRRAARAIGD